MKVIVAKDYDALSRAAADIVADVIRNNPTARMGLATGSTPVGLYRCLAEDCKAGKLDFSKACSVNLDEYAGLEGTHPQSYRYFMNTNLFDHINIDKANTFVACGVGDQEANLAQFRAVLAEKPIDVQVLGIGVDGHIGFNEPGEALWNDAHVETLDPSTIEANARFFDSADEVPKTAYTMGMGNIMRAKKIVMVINGANKAAVTKDLLMNDKVHCGNPATFIKLHSDVTVVIDQELADLIGYNK